MVLESHVNGPPKSLIDVLKAKGTQSIIKGYVKLLVGFPSKYWH